MSSQGALYIVATPIGNLEDITLRALRVLEQVDWIAAEDTRHTRKLLTHYGLKTKCLSYREQNHSVALKKILGLLDEGRQLALVSDAGMPGISDPGRALVAEAVQSGFRVIPIPGPCAAVCALAASGLSTERFLFMGFLPRKIGELKRCLHELVNEPGTLVFYESPMRIGKTLEIMSEVFGSARRAVLTRELTKIHEEFRAATLGELTEAGRGPIKGEVTLLVEGNRAKRLHIGSEIKSLMNVLRAGRSLPPGQIAGMLASITGLERNTLYRILIESSDDVN